MSLCDRNCVIVLTNRARCALYKNLLYEESVLERIVVELVYKFDEKSTASVLKG